jgi:hypothetical protein
VVFDTIVDFSAGDIIDFSDKSISVNSALTPATEGKASISTTGFATFNSAYLGISQREMAVENAISTNAGFAAGNAATFTLGSDSYLFVSDSTAGLSSGDVLIKLKNVVTTGVYPTVSGDVVMPYTVSEFSSATLVANDTVVIGDKSSSINTFISTISSGNAAKIDLIDSNDTNTVSLTTTNADTLRTAGTKFASNDSISLAATDGTTLIGTTYKQSTLGGAATILLDDTTDSAVSITTTQYTTMNTNGQKFVSGDSVTVTDADATTLIGTTYKQSNLGGGATVFLDDTTDSAVSIASTVADTAITNGQKFVVGNTVTVTKTDATTLIGTTYKRIPPVVRVL